MKGNSLRTGTCGSLGGHRTIHLVESGDNLTGTLLSSERAQALRAHFLTRQLNGGDPVIYPLLINLGHQCPGHSAKQVLHWQLPNHQVAVGTGADRLFGLELLLVA